MIIERRVWIVPARPNGLTQADYDNAAANNTGEIAIKPDFIVPGTGLPVEEPGYLLVEQSVQEDRAPFIKRNVTFNSQPTISLNLDGIDSGVGTLEIDQAVLFEGDAKVEDGSRFILLVINQSGSGQQISFDSRFVNIATPQTVPTNRAVMAEFVGLAGRLVHNGILVVQNLDDL